MVNKNQEMIDFLILIAIIIAIYYIITQSGTGPLFSPADIFNGG